MLADIRPAHQPETPMKRLILAAILAAVATVASASACTQQTIFLPNGKVLYCQTCCWSGGNCQTTCF